MRIIGGTHGGAANSPPLGKGDDRPLICAPRPDRVRESLFNLLTQRRAMHEASRRNPRARSCLRAPVPSGWKRCQRGGAATAYASSSQGRKSAGASCAKNIALLKATDACHAVAMARDARLPAGPYDAARPDLPRSALRSARSGRTEAHASALRCAGLDRAHGALIWSGKRRASPVLTDLTQIDQRRYGDTIVTLARAQIGWQTRDSGACPRIDIRRLGVLSRPPWRHIALDTKPAPSMPLGRPSPRSSPAVTFAPQRPRG